MRLTHFSSPEILVKLFRERSRVTKLAHSCSAPIAAILRLLKSNKIIVLKSNFYAAVLTYKGVSFVSAIVKL